MEQRNSSDDAVANSIERRYVGTILGERYEILSPLDRGGMSTVFLAQHTVLERMLAVKILDGRHTVQKGGPQRLFREAQAAAAIGHPNIVDVLDVGVSDLGHPYLVMELLRGEDLARFLDRHAPLPAAAALGILEPVLMALGAAHAKSIVHRDLKPGNIFVEPAGDAPSRVKLIDFGIAKLLNGKDKEHLTVGGTVMGTPCYMSPEQARGSSDLGPAVDIYSAGVVLYQMLSGELPFDGSNYNETLHLILSEEVPPPQNAMISEPLMEILRTALAKNPADRFASTDAFLQALSELPEWGPRRSTVETLTSTIRVTEPRQVLTQASTMVSPVNSTPHPPNDASTRLDGPIPEAQEVTPDARAAAVKSGTLLQAGAAAAESSTNSSELSPSVPSGDVGIPKWWLLLGAVALMVLLALASRSESTTKEANSAATISTTVVIEVVGAPPNARLLFDGHPVPNNPFKTRQSKVLMPLRVEAEGYTPFTAMIRPAESSRVKVHLTQLQPSPPPVVAPSPEVQPHPDTETPRKSGVTRGEKGDRVNRTPTPNPSSMGTSGRGTLYSDKFE